MSLLICRYIGVSIAGYLDRRLLSHRSGRCKKTIGEIYKYSPSEIICNDAFLVSGVDVEDLKGRLHICINPLEARLFDEDGCKRALLKHFKVNVLTGLGIEDFPTGIVAAGALLQYLLETQKVSLDNFTHLYPYLTSKYMLLDQFYQKKSGINGNSA